MRSFNRFRGNLTGYTKKASPQVLTPEQQIAQLSNLKLWLKPSTMVADGSGKVASWNDASASGFDFVQAVTANQPVTSSINGLDVPYFSGAGAVVHRLQSDGTPSDFMFLVSGSGCSLFVVYAAAAGSGQVSVIDSRNASNASTGISVLHSMTNRNIQVLTSTGSAARVNATTPNGVTTAELPALFGFHYSEAQNPEVLLRTGSFQVQTSTTATNPAGGSIPSFALALGARATSGTSPFNGKICEIIMFDRRVADNASDLSLVENYLIAKYGIV